MAPASGVQTIPSDQVLKLPTEAESTLVIAGEHAFSPGDFLTAPPGANTPDGFLLKVINARVAGGNTEVQTAPASIYEAVPNGEIDADLGDLASASPVNADAKEISKALRRSGGNSGSEVPFEKKVTCQGSSEMTLTGSMTTSLAPHLELKWHKFLDVPVGIDKAKATLDSSIEAEVEGIVSGQGICTLGPVTLFEPQWVIWVEVGAVPVPLTIDVPIQP